MFTHVLILSPHTDDAEIGAGGTIAKLSEKKITLHMIAFSWCDEEDNKKAVEKAAKILSIKKPEILDFTRRNFPKQRQEILQVLYDYNQQHQPDLVLTPMTTDLHQDHSTITQETMRAFKSSTILGYEMPWNNIQITTNSFIPLEETHVQKKINALNCYDSQKNRYYFTEEYFRSILQMRGTQIQTKYAEAFEVIKFVPNL
jgi:LmbE family N-acetylglucosaminyl deacetylase